MSSIIFTIAINGVDVPVTLDDAALAAIAEAASSAQPEEQWPQWMSITTAARYLDVSVQRLRKLVATKQIPFVQEGYACRLFFSRTDLDDWMRSFQQCGGAA
jgi:excisionase family DNA binding protein